MNRKVVKTLIILTIAYLCAWYILKIFFPEMFVLSVNNDKLISIGAFIDSHWYLNILCRSITSFITYWLYLCAVCKIKKLGTKHIICVIIAIILGFVFEYLIVDLLTYYSILAMLIIPAIFNTDLRRVVFVFSFHLICQWLSLQIRGLSTMIMIYNFLTTLIMTLECYFWLFLFYLLFNYYEKEKS